MKKSTGKARAAPKEHWEMSYNPTAASKNMHDVAGSDFNPKCPKDRKTTYVKVNEADH